MAFGLLLIGPPTLLWADANQLNARTVSLLVIAGLSNVVGLRIEYAALRRGKIGVVVPIVSTEGVIATLIAVIEGLRLSLGTAILLIIVSLGVMLAASRPDPPDLDGRTAGVRSAVLALAVAVLFGISLFTTGRAGREVSVLWVLVSARLFGTALIAAPVAAGGVPRPPLGVLTLLMVAGAAEVLGNLSYIVGARQQLAIAAVLSSQFAALAVIGAYFAFHERLSRSQIAGLVLVAVGVGLLAGTSP